MSNRSYTKAEEAFFIGHWGRLSVPEMARRLGRSRSGARRHALLLLSRGLLNPEEEVGVGIWRQRDLKWAVDKMKKEGWPLEKVAEMLGRGPHGLRERLRQWGFLPGRAGPRHPGTLTLHRVMEAMGTGRPTKVRGWIACGALVAHRFAGCGRGTPYRVYPADLISFLQESPHLYHYDAMPRFLSGKPNPWRPYARRHLPEVLRGRITTREAAPFLGVTAWTVRGYCRRGILPAILVADVPGVARREYWIEKDAVMALAGQKRAA